MKSASEAVIIGGGIMGSAIAFFLAKMGIVNYQMLARNRKYAIMIVVVVAAVLTPPDVISQILLAIPLIGLYELSIWVTHFVNRGKEEDQYGDEPDEDEPSES